VLDQGALLFGQAQRITLLVHRPDPLEQLRVQVDGVHVLGQLRRQRLLGGLQGRVGVRRGHGIEHQHGARQQRAGALHRLDGVGEGGRLGVVGDGADLAQVLAHPLLDRRLVVGVADAVERRGLERQRAGAQQGVLALGVGGGGIGHGGVGGRTFAAGGQGQGDRRGK